MTQNEALKLTLDWLKSNDFVYPTGIRNAIKETLAQPVQPVQRTWVGLTDEEIKGLWTSRVSWTNNNFARAVEQLLKEKNT